MVSRMNSYFHLIRIFALLLLSIHHNGGTLCTVAFYSPMVPRAYPSNDGHWNALSGHNAPIRKHQGNLPVGSPSFSPPPVSEIQQSRVYKGSSLIPTYAAKSEVSALSSLPLNGVVDLATAEKLVFESHLPITSLYVLSSCPFCQKVLTNFPSLLDSSSPVIIKNVKDRNDEAFPFKEELLKKTQGVKQVPALEIGNDYILLESADILALLGKKFGEFPQSESVTEVATMASNDISDVDTPAKEDSEATEISSFADPTNENHELKSPSASESSGNLSEESLHTPQETVSPNSLVLASQNSEQSAYLSSASAEPPTTSSTSSLQAEYPQQFVPYHTRERRRLTDEEIQCMVFVGNISWQASKEDLESCLALAGTIVSCSLFMNNWGQHKGCARVTYATKEEAENAIRTLDNSFFKGRKINVQAYTRPYARFGNSTENPPWNERSPRFSSYASQQQRPSYDQRRTEMTTFPSSYDSSIRSDESFSRPPTSHVSNTVVFVWNLPHDMYPQDLKEMFRGTGVVRHAQVMSLPDVSTNRLGVVMFSSERDARQAVSNFRNTRIYGKKIAVTMSKQSPSMVGNDEGFRPFRGRPETSRFPFSRSAPPHSAMQHPPFDERWPAPSRNAYERSEKVLKEPAFENTEEDSAFAEVSENNSEMLYE
ncbi:hypothetical protein IE077_004125 [Cardiosporidium cionae]|uniref:RRM domain-containing protein n=1 Tax=Cardiosporidium cionae TaxID=476202 RepID=A0ABQ7J6S2_9APIC|nr:hypothetical protein IE077_004125 [Cardiosporidium cionae]|eukprot:KAF8819687.1 hypothetical protein IE077_004125 [Cardiosporidium cionae]